METPGMQKTQRVASAIDSGVPFYISSANIEHVQFWDREPTFSTRQGRLIQSPAVVSSNFKATCVCFARENR